MLTLLARRETDQEEGDFHEAQSASEVLQTHILMEEEMMKRRIQDQMAHENRLIHTLHLWIRMYLLRHPPPEFEPDHLCNQNCQEENNFVRVYSPQYCCNRCMQNSDIEDHPELRLFACVRHGTFHRCGIGQCYSFCESKDGRRFCVYSGISGSDIVGTVAMELNQSMLQLVMGEDHAREAQETEAAVYGIGEEKNNFVAVHDMFMVLTKATVVNYNLLHRVATLRRDMEEKKRRANIDNVLHRSLREDTEYTPQVRQRRKLTIRINPPDRSTVRPEEISAMQELFEMLVFDRRRRTAALKALTESASRDRYDAMESLAQSQSALRFRQFQVPNGIVMPSMMEYWVESMHATKHLQRYACVMEGQDVVLKGVTTPEYSQTMVNVFMRKILTFYSIYKQLDDVVKSTQTCVAMTLYIILHLGEGDIELKDSIIESNDFFRQWLPTPEWSAVLNYFTEDSLNIEVKTYMVGRKCFHDAIYKIHKAKQFLQIE